MAYSIVYIQSPCSYFARWRRERRACRRVISSRDAVATNTRWKCERSQRIINQWSSVTTNQLRQFIAYVKYFVTATSTVARYIGVRGLLFCDVQQGGGGCLHAAVLSSFARWDSQTEQLHAAAKVVSSRLLSFETRSREHSLGTFCRYAHSLRTLAIIIWTLHERRECREKCCANRIPVINTSAIVTVFSRAIGV